MYILLGQHWLGWQFKHTASSEATAFYPLVWSICPLYAVSYSKPPKLCVYFFPHPLLVLLYINADCYHPMSQESRKRHTMFKSIPVCYLKHTSFSPSQPWLVMLPWKGACKSPQCSDSFHPDQVQTFHSLHSLQTLKQKNLDYDKVKGEHGIMAVDVLRQLSGINATDLVLTMSL